MSRDDALISTSNVPGSATQSFFSGLQEDSAILLKDMRDFLEG